MSVEVVTVGGPNADCAAPPMARDEVVTWKDTHPFVVYDVDDAMLTRIFVDNFRAFVNFEFRPEPLTLLLGDNGGGKTSLFDVLAFTSDVIVRGAKVSDLFWYTRTQWDTRSVQRFELDIQGVDGLYRYSLEVEHPADQTKKPAIRSESVTFNGNHLFRFSDGQVQIFRDDYSAGPGFPFRSEQSFLANLDPPGSKLGWFKQAVSGIRIVRVNPFSIEAVSKVAQPYLSPYGGNFPSFFRYLNDERPDVRTALENQLRRVLPGFRNMHFKSVGLEEKILLFAFGDEAGKAVEFNLYALSEGQRALAILYAALLGLVGSSSIVCFDEPENFVSLLEIQPWLQVLRDCVTEKGGQVMLISHHPEVVDYLGLENAWRFERSTGPVRPSRLELDLTGGLRPSEILARGG